MSNQYTVTWTVDVEVMGDHKDAAQAVAGEPAEFGKNRTLRFSGHP